MSATLSLLLALLMLGTLAGCTGDRPTRNPTDNPAFVTLNHEVASPSGRYRLKLVPKPPDNGVRTAAVQILNNDATVEFEDPTVYSLNHTTLVTWADGKDEAWVYSGDVGTSVISKSVTVGWDASSWRDLGSPRAPEALRKARPETFT